MKCSSSTDVQIVNSIVQPVLKMIALVAVMSSVSHKNTVLGLKNGASWKIPLQDKKGN